MLKVEIRTDNAAFQEGEPAWECARILTQIAEKLRSGVTGGRCMDANGNSVGVWSLDRD